ncbi:hypothetical protein OG799_09245 [Micromonospora sp. NBC_00898]|nr:hypothetical protein OG799_09245 [Micromonospora sp. NBC_00898]
MPAKGKSLTARHLSRYFARGQGGSTYARQRHRHPRRHPGQLRPVRPGRQPSLASVTWRRPPSTGPDGAAAGGPRPLPVPQNALTSAIKEYGALRAARYLADETYRRRISSTSARTCTPDTAPSPGRRGSDPLPAPGAADRARCLTLTTNAIVCWPTPPRSGLPGHPPHHRWSQAAALVIHRRMEGSSRPVCERVMEVADLVWGEAIEAEDRVG